MSVDTRAHIVRYLPQYNVVLRRTMIDGSGGRHKGVGIRRQDGAECFLTPEELGVALRTLKVSAADLGYKKPVRRA